MEEYLSMNYKILLFLSLMLITSTIVSATENTTSDNTIISDNTDNQDNTNIIREDNKNIKKTPATSIELDDAYAETYYGGRITYNAKSDNENQVNEGKISLYVNNTHITTENVAESIDWIYNEEYNEVLDTLIPGDYPMKIIYQNDDTRIESNNATLYISKANSYIYQNGEITNDNTDITLPLSIMTESNAIAINHGSITAYYNNTEITSIDVKDDEVTTLTLASNYHQYQSNCMLHLFLLNFHV